MIGKRLRLGVVFQGSADRQAAFDRMPQAVCNVDIVDGHAAVVAKRDGKGNGVAGIDQSLIYNGGNGKLGFARRHGNFLAVHRLRMRTAACGEGCLRRAGHRFGRLNGFGDGLAGARLERQPGHHIIRHGRVCNFQPADIGRAGVFQAVCQLNGIARLHGSFADRAREGKRGLFRLMLYGKRHFFCTVMGIRSPIHYDIGIGGIQVARRNAAGDGKRIRSAGRDGFIDLYILSI